MPRISFKKNNHAPIEVPLNTNLMKALLQADLPVASSCDGDGVCAKCKIIIVEGAGNLSQENDTEIFLKESNNIPHQARISCQTEVLGDIVIDTTYW